MAKVVLQTLGKTYTDKAGKSLAVVKDVNLTIEDGEFMVLVGPSGCGKSTTLRMIAGLESISEGDVFIGDKRVNHVAPKDRDIAMVFQNYALYPHMSVFENMAFGLKLRRLPKAEIEIRVREATAMLGLEALLERKPKALSGGQRQRVAVGRAIVRKPEVFLFDEPLSNLDAKMRVSTRAEISKLHAKLNATMIYVTHDQVEAMTMGDRICVMKDGKIMQVAEPLVLYNQPANLFVASFIGSPGINLLKGSIQKCAGDHVLFHEKITHPDSIALEFYLSDSLSRKARDYVDKEIIIGIRPEAVEVATDISKPAQAKVDLVEPMGSETYVYLSTSGHALIARMKPDSGVTMNDQVALNIDTRKAILFDPASELAL